MAAPELAIPARWEPREPSVGPVGVSRAAGHRVAGRPQPEPARDVFVYDGAGVGRAARAGLSRRTVSSRPLPMENVYFHVKKLDNSNLRRRPDPRDKVVWSRLVVGGLLGLVMMILTFAPRPLLRHSGYRIEKLSEKHQALVEIQDQLRVRQARLSDLRRVVDLAGRQGLEQTPPERFAWQNRTIPPVSREDELAWNRRNAQP